MRNRKIIFVLGILILLFFTQAFAQEEIEVIKRYDYSSPRVSYESFKKAIENKDCAGMIIHDWQAYKSAKGSSCYGKSLEDTIVDSRNSAGECVYYERVQYLGDYSFFLLSNSNFVKESEKEHTEGEDEGISVTVCYLTIEDKDTGKTGEIMAFKYDNSNEWWICLDRE